jgi:hypothetical protein
VAKTTKGKTLMERAWAYTDRVQAKNPSGFSMGHVDGAYIAGYKAALRAGISGLAKRKKRK